MAMELERHEEILSSLNDPDLTHEDRANLLTELRSDYGQVLQDTAKSAKSIEDLEETNKDLLNTNSMLFRQLGEREDPTKTKKTPSEEQKDYSETVTMKNLFKPVL